jgi:hypothetical protein
MLQKVLELRSQISVVKMVINPWAGRSGFDYHHGPYTFPSCKISDELWSTPRLVLPMFPSLG